MPRVGPQPPERPAKTDVEAVVRCYFGLLRAGRIPEAEQLIDHHPVRHVLKALWTGSVEASADGDGDGPSGGSAHDEDEQHLETNPEMNPEMNPDLHVSWLGELDLADFHWGDTGSHVYVEITYRAQIIEVSLGFWVRPTDAGRVVTGPSTYW
ncbi:hypothetical protein E4N62_43415 [Streptomyces sp. MNU76]|uniref:hypothetical protein n=1 Tax=Streptomyces sp. MNU76 TaxID=2560026 RepID=UPI001E483330|nr:hypothetical protein [Streptomyces sp. MNU76]MCC9711472.1 hypothetical protein [Streptomyces sp. MNU76]